MSKKVLIDAMFNQFSSFLEELKQMYPNDPDFPVFITTLSLLKSTNPMMVINVVNSDILVPFGDKIAVRDESFFLNEDYTNNADVDLDIVQKLKQYVKSMSPNSKDMVWKYIEIITQICLKLNSI
jgi:hypothetical protein